MEDQDNAPSQPRTYHPISSWAAALDPREQAQIAHARHYRANFSHAGAPGHGQFLLLAKLADLIDGLTGRAGDTDG